MGSINKTAAVAGKGVLRTAFGDCFGSVHFVNLAGTFSQ